MAPLEMGVRILAIVGKELVEIVRRPGAIVSLVLGPFLIMAIFGLGFSGVRRPLDTVIVLSPDSGLPTDAKTYQDLAGGRMHVIAITPDQAAAEAQLKAGTIDVVIVAPSDAEAQFRAGRPSTIKVEIDATDPYDEGYASLMASAFAAGVNQEIIRRVAAEGQGYVVADVSDAIPPEVVAEPTRAELVNIAPTKPTVTAYFAPAVLALVLQHLAVTLIALSLVRERTSGAIELFRVAPVNAWELLAGKVLALGLVGAAIAALTVALLVVGLGVPMLGDPGQLAVVIGLLLLASLGVGLLIAMVSDSERQTVQLSLFVLLASVFFSGFVLAIDQFIPAVRALAYLLPVTHGIRLIQDIMLRGQITEAWQVAALGGIAVVTLTASWLLLRRGMTVA
jgi:ABC-2 type transport system permease protein